MSDSNPKESHTCPHCGSILKPIQMPDQMGWHGEVHLVCFNNDCSYYREGWDWIMEQYEAKASYRYRLNPETGKASPIGVWSETALLDRIVES